MEIIVLDMLRREGNKNKCQRENISLWKESEVWIKFVGLYIKIHYTLPNKGPPGRRRSTPLFSSFSLAFILFSLLSPGSSYRITFELHPTSPRLTVTKIYHTQ
jgi:hypothetical protein